MADHDHLFDRLTRFLERSLQWAGLLRRERIDRDAKASPQSNIFLHVMEKIETRQEREWLVDFIAQLYKNPAEASDQHLVAFLNADLRFRRPSCLNQLRWPFYRETVDAVREYTNFERLDRLVELATLDPTGVLAYAVEDALTDAAEQEGDEWLPSFQYDISRRREHLLTFIAAVHDREQEARKIFSSLAKNFRKKDPEDPASAHRVRRNADALRNLHQRGS